MIPSILALTPKESRKPEEELGREEGYWLWKEYLLDKKPVSGVLLDNNLLIWFPARQELFGQKTAELAREKYPDAKVVARFNFGERAVGMSSVDLAIRSNSEVFDNHIDSLISYFGRSLDWQE